MPKRMNQIRVGGTSVPGSLTTPDPAEETAALERARYEESEREREGRAGDAERVEHVKETAGLPEDGGRPSAG